MGTLNPELSIFTFNYQQKTSCIYHLNPLFWLNGISFYPNYAAYNVRLIKN